MVLKLWLLLAQFLVLPLVIAQEPTSEQVETFAKISQTMRPLALITAEQELKEARRSRPKPRTESNIQYWETKIQKLENRIQVLEDPLKPYYAPLWPGREWGDNDGPIGFIERLQAQVTQVLPNNEALIKLVYFRTVPATSANSFQRQESDTVLYYLENYPLDGVTDDQGIDIKGLFYKGTKQYQSIAGVKTVPMLRRIDLEQYQDKFTSRDKVRTWTAKTGHKMEAIFVRSQRGKVSIVNLNGKTLDLSLDQLSDEDREYVRDQILARKPKKG